MAAGDSLLHLSPMALHRAGVADRGGRFGVKKYTQTDLSELAQEAIEFPKGDIDPEIITKQILANRYAGGNGLTLNLCLSADFNVAAGVAVFGFTVDRLQANTSGVKISVPTWGTEKTANLTVPTAEAGRYQYVTITATVAEADSAAAGEAVMIRVRRLCSNASDTCTGSIFLHSLELRQAA